MTRNVPKRVDSNRTKGSGPIARRARHARPKTRASNAPPVKPDIDEILGRLSDAISVVATAANALLDAEEREGSTAGADVEDEITTLLHADVHSERMLTCAVWLARADAFKAEAKRAIARRDQARLSAAADTLEWAAVDLSKVIQSLEEEDEPQKKQELSARRVTVVRPLLVLLADLDGDLPDIPKVG